jgi:hypothetical protein
LCTQYSVAYPTLALPTPLSASAQLSPLFQPLFPSMCTASLHASHPLPFSCLHFRHGNGTWNMELGREQLKRFCQSGVVSRSSPMRSAQLTGRSGRGDREPTRNWASSFVRPLSSRAVDRSAIPPRPYSAFVCPALSSAALGLRRQAGWLRLATGSTPTSLFLRSGLYRDGPRNELVSRVTSRWRASAHPARWDSGWQRPGSFPSVTGTTRSNATAGRLARYGL